MASVAQKSQPPRVANDDVELIAVCDEQAEPAGRRMHAVAENFDTVEAGATIVAQALIVVAGDEHEPRTAAHLAEKGLHHVAMGLRPDRPPA